MAITQARYVEDLRRFLEVSVKCGVIYYEFGFESTFYAEQARKKCRVRDLLERVTKRPDSVTLEEVIWIPASHGDLCPINPEDVTSNTETLTAMFLNTNTSPQKFMDTMEATRKWYVSELKDLAEQCYRCNILSIEFAADGQNYTTTDLQAFYKRITNHSETICLSSRVRVSGLDEPISVSNITRSIDDLATDTSKI